MKKNLQCNKPVKSWRKGKKLAVLACEGNEEKLLHFGAKGMSDFTIHKDKKRRANFRARHRCDTDPPSKLTPRYWSCEHLW